MATKMPTSVPAGAHSIHRKIAVTPYYMKGVPSDIAELCLGRAKALAATLQAYYYRLRIAATWPPSGGLFVRAPIVGSIVG